MVFLIILLRDYFFVVLFRIHKEHSLFGICSWMELRSGFCSGDVSGTERRGGGKGIDELDSFLNSLFKEKAGVEKDGVV